jgi:hypothetical protein
MMTQSATERNEYLREKWEREFADHAMKAIVENTLIGCPIKFHHPGDRWSKLVYAIEAAFRENLSVEERIQMARESDSDVLDYESFVDRETDEDEGE